MARRTLYIHAGAHRTGTSSFQMCLHQNRKLLNAAGFDLAYPGRDGIPSGDLGLRLPAPRHGNDALRRFSRKARQEITRKNPDPQNPLILSEENIPGRMIHFQSGQFYPATEARLRALKEGLGDARIPALLLVLRDYAGLFVSAHRKRAEDNTVEPFVRAINNLMKIDRGWPEFVQLFRDILRPEKLLLIDYSQRGTSVNLLGTLVPGLGDLPLSEPRRLSNFSATDAGLIALQARYKAGEKLERTQWQEVISEHAEDRMDYGFAKFSDDQRQQLTDRYQRDLQVLQTMSDVIFLT